MTVENSNIAIFFSDKITYSQLCNFFVTVKSMVKFMKIIIGACSGPDHRQFCNFILEIFIKFFVYGFAEKNDSVTVFLIQCNRDLTAVSGSGNYQTAMVFMQFFLQKTEKWRNSWITEQFLHIHRSHAIKTNISGFET
jgi:hypothetical protein